MKDGKKASGVTRRGMIQMIGGALGAALVGGVETAREPAAAATGATKSGRTRTRTSDLQAATPEGEIGPYFTDDSAAGFHRRDVRPNIDGTNPQPGIPLALTLAIYDSENHNAPVPGAQIDIWHCNASGVYSNEAMEGTIGQTWLRGFQVTDANGKARFNTIVPGWYPGRTTHIHLRVRSRYSEAFSTSDGSNTTQSFFSQALLNQISTTAAPYNAEGINPTTNLRDHVYTDETHARTELVLKGSTAAGFSAVFSIYLPVTRE